jgi:para-nitrobenzyl esterase
MVRHYHRDEITVETPLGLVRAFASDGVVRARGMRYATAQRWEPPEPVSSWSTPIDATAFGAQCPQLESLLERTLGLASSVPAASEDCLFLNVAAPACDGGRRPVVVWVHGGAFLSGSGSNPWYDGRALALRGDVVVVTINYRLGVFGFPGASNLGLRDQVAALQVVRQLAPSFGGDPANVTVVGQSAGGASVLALLTMPAARDLFHKAFAASPSTGQIRPRRRADEALAQLLRLAGVGDLRALERVGVDELLALQQRFIADPDARFSGLSPCRDGELVPTGFSEAVAWEPRPLVVGTTLDEMQLFAIAPSEITSDIVAQAYARHYGARADDALEVMRRTHRGATDRVLLAALETEVVLRAPARSVADARAAVGRPTWTYLFTWASRAFGGTLGSCHALDVPFLFDNTDAEGVETFTGPGEDRRAVAGHFADALLGLAHDGDPGWRPYTVEGREYQRIDATCVLDHDLEPELRALDPAADSVSGR